MLLHLSLIRVSLIRAELDESLGSPDVCPPHLAEFGQAIALDKAS
jgi:hypothetical protein